MRILIAGGAGYIGSALVPALIDRGYDIAPTKTFNFDITNFF